MQTRPSMMVGLPPDRMVAFVESQLGPLENLRTLGRPVSQVKATQRWLGWWAYEHPQHAGPWRRERVNGRRIRATQGHPD
jgi:hypothetical protein